MRIARPAALSEPISYRSFLDRHGPIGLAPARRTLRWMGRFAVGLTIFSVLPLASDIAASAFDPRYLLAMPLYLAFSVLCLRGSRIERIVLDADGVAVLPAGPMIPAAEIVSIEERQVGLPWFPGPKRWSFVITLSRRRLIPLLGPVSAFGSPIGITGAEAPARPLTQCVERPRGRRRHPGTA